MVRVGEKFLKQITKLAKDGYSTVDISFARGVNLSDPVDPQDLVTKNYVDLKISKIDLTGPAGGDLDGYYPNPLVKSLTVDGNQLTFGTINDGDFLGLQGNVIIGVTPSTSQSLAQTLEIGNETGNNSIVISDGYTLSGYYGATNAVLPAFKYEDSITVNDDYTISGFTFGNLDTGGGRATFQYGTVYLYSPDSNSISGSEYFLTGKGGVSSGGFFFKSGDATSATSGSYQFISGDAPLSGGFYTATGNSTTTSGSIEFKTGNANTLVGNFTFTTGNGPKGGTYTIQTGNGTNGSGGSFRVSTGTGTTSGGVISLSASGSASLMSQTDIAQVYAKTDVYLTGDASANITSGNNGVSIKSSDSSMGPSGSLSLKSGNTPSSLSGSVLVHTGDQTNSLAGGASGNLDFHTGSIAGGGSSGTIALYTGNQTSASGGGTGGISVYSGNMTGSGTSGSIDIHTGSLSAYGVSGNVSISTGNVAVNGSGKIALTTGNVTTTSTTPAGNIELSPGNGYTSDYDGYVVLKSRTATWYWPRIDGTTGQALVTNGSGVLSWANASGGGGSSETVIDGYFTSDQNDYSPTGWETATHVRLSSDASRSVTGFVNAASPSTRYIINVGSYNIVLVNQSSLSTIGNRITIPGAINFTLEPNDVATIWYDNVSLTWRIL